jgi:hypothetical protein
MESNDVVIFNILLNSDIDTIYNMCQASEIADKICKDKHFWELKFEHDNLIILRVREDIDGWWDEYNEVKDSTINTNDIIRISLIEKKRDIEINSFFPNDGTIIIKFSDEYKYDYNTWLLPKELTSLVPEKLNRNCINILDFLYPIQIRFVPNNDDTYKLTYELFCEENEVSMDNLSLKEMKNILIKSLYENISVMDKRNLRYLFNDREPYDEQITNSKYFNMTKNSRLGMRDTFEYLRDNNTRF